MLRGTAKPAGSAVFKACAFNRQAVVSAKEFAGSEVHLATAALVLHRALRELDVEPALAKRLVRAIIVPGELPLTPPPEPPKLIHFRDLNKR